MILTKHNFIAWLTNRGFALVPGTQDIYENGDVRYRVAMQSGARRTRISANRWSAEDTFRYNRRFINRDGKLDWLR